MSARVFDIQTGKPKRGRPRKAPPRPVADDTAELERRLVLKNLTAAVQQFDDFSRRIKAGEFDGIGYSDAGTLNNVMYLLRGALGIK